MTKTNQHSALCPGMCDTVFLHSWSVSFSAGNQWIRKRRFGVEQRRWQAHCIQDPRAT